MRIMMIIMIMWRMRIMRMMMTIMMMRMMRMVRMMRMMRKMRTMLTSGCRSIPEIFLTRLLSTKGTVQKFVDDFFGTILKVRHQPNYCYYCHHSLYLFIHPMLSYDQTLSNDNMSSNVIVFYEVMLIRYV